MLGGFLLASAVAPLAARAQVASDTAVTVTVGAFVDGYYAWDFGRPANFDRSFAGGALFTTQPARHNEFNVNLAFVEVRLSGARARGRIALQAGTSVQANYAGESSQGQTSGPSLARLIQEAVAGVRVAPGLWVDGGIFFSHMGMESWISRDNLTYTRSLVAEYSPYYSSGVRAVWEATPRLTAHLHLVNGWQAIAENNSGKGAGLRVDYRVSDATSVSYYNFFSDEAGSRLRTFNGVGAKHARGRLSMLGQLDVGSQRHAAELGGTSNWFGYTAIARLQLTATTAFTARFEGFGDPDQVVLATGSTSVATNPAFRGRGASVGVDISPDSRVLWRSELRGFTNRSAVFPSAGGAPRKGNAVLVTSLALLF